MNRPATVVEVSRCDADRVRLSRVGAGGFTLVEILIVVVILGILAAMVIPSFAGAVTGSRQQSFVSSVKAIESAAAIYTAKTGLYLEDSSSGSMPAGFDAYLDPSEFTNGTPIGGVWDFEFDSWGITSAFGVHFDGTGETQDEAYMAEIDTIFDDGELTTGGFQQLASDRFYYIIED